MGRGVVVKRSKILEVLRKLGATNRTVAVGVLGSDATALYKDADGATVAEVATWNHYGTGSIPARPFMTVALAQHKDQIAKIQARIARGLLEEKLELDQALGLLGEFIVSAVKQTIADGVAPANAESTVKQKGSSTPLINYGQLRGSITWQVRDGR